MHNLAGIGSLDDKCSLNAFFVLDEVMVYSRSGKQRRNRSMLGIDITVAEHNVVTTLIYSLFSLKTKALDSLAQALSSIFHGKSHLHLAGVESFVTKVAENVELRVGENRTVKLHHLAEVGGRFKQVHFDSTNVAVEAHHEFLAERVDRWVGDLGEVLAEVVEERLGKVAHNSQWSIVTHGVDRLFGIGYHRGDNLLNFLLVIVESGEESHIVGDIIIHLFAAVDLVEFYAVFGEPVAVGELIGKIFLEKCVIVDLAFLHIYHEHFTGAETSLFFHLRSLKWEDTHFGSYNDGVVVGDEVTCRAQTIAVEHTADISAIAEEQCGGTVPSFHENAVILIESLQFGRNWVLVVERLRHKHSKSVRERHSSHHEVFKHVVERGTVAHIGLNDWRDIGTTERFRIEHTLSGVHPHAVSLNGVDFAIVTEHTEGLCKAPCGECVCAET